MMLRIESENKQDVVPVQEVIKLLTNPESKDACDDSCERFKEREILPPYYNEEKFKRGQQFYHKHIFAMFFGKLLGLITIISTPNILKILMFTNMSSKPLTAYRRYLATIFHMCVWYDNDFKPGSELWKSMNAVKSLHNLASKRSCAANGERILQKHMGITQFGFMACAIIRPELIGIHNATKEELESFVHLWRVIGYIMGMEDRYNICRESLDETKEICEALISNLFIPNIKMQDPCYLMMADTMIKGMWTMEPVLETKTFFSYLHYLLDYNTNNNNNNENKLPAIQLNLFQRIYFVILQYYVFLMKFKLIRWFSNATQYTVFWLMRIFPFLALYKFGYKNSYVSINIKRDKRLG